MKYSYLLEEKVTYTREIILDTDMSEDELIEEMEKAEKKSFTAEDVAMYLDDVKGIEVKEVPDTDMRSPNDVELEYYDHRDIG